MNLNQYFITNFCLKDNEKILFLNILILTILSPKKTLDCGKGGG